MDIIQILLITIWVGICSIDDQATQWLRRPLLIGPLIGIILGDVTQGLIISGTLELMWMGLGNMAGYQTPDMIIGTAVGVVFGITTGKGAATGVAFAVPVALLVQQIFPFYMAFRQFYTPLARKLTKDGNFKGINKLIALAMVIQFFYRAIPTFLILYFGDGIINTLLDSVPENVMNGLSVASQLLPAVGLAILMQLLIKKGIWLFILLGFVLTAYLELPIMAVTIIGIIFGFIYDLASTTNAATTVVVAEEDDL
ncbi:PTS mannose/fructose/sorbose/N-acetylgalactosamine transporter subunit IIC [Enterococcus sp. AZ109]|uniref:PTS mannose/fructose/sorbose/N-acetylgalactosamine transporter subunit IIC n=1 Tax=Enterococcus sp. AZ109 TaxID=2774634 RepID=UPI003F23EDCB